MVFGKCMGFAKIAPLRVLDLGCLANLADASTARVPSLSPTLDNNNDPTSITTHANCT